MSKLSQGPSDAKVTPVASDGILSPENQAKIAAARAEFLDSIAKIQDPALRFRAVVNEIAPLLDMGLSLASAYPGAAPFVNALRQQLTRIETTIATDKAGA